MSDPVTEPVAQVETPPAVATPPVETPPAAVAPAAPPVVEPPAVDPSTKSLEERIAATERVQAEQAIPDAITKWPLADEELLKDALAKGKHVNEIRYLARISHEAVAKYGEKIKGAAGTAAEREIAERFGVPVGTGAPAAGTVDPRDLEGLSVDEKLAKSKDLKRTERTRF